jgi:hypothetical protein
VSKLLLADRAPQLRRLRLTANLSAGFPKAIVTNAVMAERCGPIIGNNSLQLFD